MTPVFADTSFYLALFSDDDAHHDRAVALSKELRTPIVTTEFIVLELGDALSALANRALFVSLYDEFLRSRSPMIVPVSPELIDQGFQLFRSRSDKSWSLTDCTSFVVMQQRGMTEALTTDRHFKQAGFTALLA